MCYYASFSVFTKSVNLLLILYFITLRPCISIDTIFLSEIAETRHQNKVND